MTRCWSLAAVALCALPSCQAYPSRPVVSAVGLSERGARSAVDPEDVLDGIATAPSPRFLFFSDRIAAEYSVFDASVLGRDLERIERYYRSRGYYTAKVLAARVVHTDAHHVRVEFSVDPGQPVSIASVAPRGLGTLPFAAALSAEQALAPLRLGKRFEEAAFEQAKRDLLDALGNHGFAFATVSAHARVDLANQAAHLEFEIKAGPEARYGPVQIVGLRELPERPIRHALRIREGDPYVRSDLADAEKALLALGVFSRVELHQDLAGAIAGRVPVQVVVEESKLRALRAGLGVQLDVLRFSNHLSLGWEHKNFLGGLRRLTLDTKPGVTLFPTRVDRLEFPSRILPENYLRLELTQPDFVEGRTAGFVVGEYNVYPLLYPLPAGVLPQQERIIGYHEFRTQVGLTRTFFQQHLLIRPSYNWYANFPFAYQGVRPLGLDEPVRVSFPALLTTLDFRDDPIQPRKGILLSNLFEFATGLFGNVSDVRVRPELRTFLPLFRQVTLATHVTFGFLFPRDYGASLKQSELTGSQTFDPTNPEVVRDQQKLLFRAFYSGGTNSNRGYPYQGVGPHGPIGFLVPTGLDCSVDRQSVNDLPAGCIRPLGGLSLWEASAELRFLPQETLSFVLFADASDVTRGVGQIRLSVPHLSVGTGLRYRTPVGPIRFDFGVRVPGMQAVGRRELTSGEGRTGEDLFGILPAAAHLAIGEAF